jgi:hypothetical protein
VQPHAVAHPDHLFAFFERDHFFNYGLSADLFQRVVDAVLAPDDTGDLALRVSNKGCRSLDNLEKEPGLALGKNLNPALVRGRQVKLVTLAQERKDEIRVIGGNVLTNIGVKKFRIDLYFDVLWLLRGRRYGREHRSESPHHRGAANQNYKEKRAFHPVSPGTENLETVIGGRVQHCKDT